jgi:hypothetical protein
VQAFEILTYNYQNWILKKHIPVAVESGQYKADALDRMKADNTSLTHWIE